MSACTMIKEVISLMIHDLYSRCSFNIYVHINFVFHCNNNSFIFKFGKYNTILVISNPVSGHGLIHQQINNKQPAIVDSDTEDRSVRFF